MVDMAAGLASMGYIPFVSTFAIFGTGRAYDQVRNGCAYSGFNVKFAFSHAPSTASVRPIRSISATSLARQAISFTFLGCFYVDFCCTKASQASEGCCSASCLFVLRYMQGVVW